MSKEALESAKRAKEESIHESAQEAEIRRLQELVTGSAPGSLPTDKKSKRNTMIAVGVIALVVIVIVIVAKKKRK